MTSAQEETTTDQNEIGELLGELFEQFEIMLAKCRVGGQRAATLGRSVWELGIVIAVKTQSNTDNETQIQTMGVVESQVAIGYDNRNLGLKLKAGPIRKEIAKCMSLV